MTLLFAVLPALAISSGLSWRAPLFGLELV